MEIKEFINGLDRLQKYYDKEYTEEQRKIMFSRLKDMSINEYNRAINLAIDKCKYLPKIADIKGVLVEPNNPVTNKPEINFIQCNKCDKGFIQYFKDIKDGERILKYSYVALCNCENGKKQKEINGYNLPFIAEVGL